MNVLSIKGRLRGVVQVKIKCLNYLKWNCVASLNLRNPRIFFPRRLRPDPLLLMTPIHQFLFISIVLVSHFLRWHQFDAAKI